MGSLGTVNSGDAANSSCIQQVIDVLKGTAGVGNIPVSFTAINDSANFAVDVQNQDGTNGRSFRARDSSGGARLQVDLALGASADPTGSGLAQIVTTSATQTQTNKTFSLLNTGTPGNSVQVPQCRVANNSSQTIGTGAETAISFNTNRWDNDNMHSTSVTPTRVKFSRAGLWRMGGGVQVDANSSGRIDVCLRLTGATKIGLLSVPNSLVAGQALQVQGEYQCSTSDYVEMTIFQNTGGNLGTIVANNYSPELWVSFVGTT